MEQKPGHRNARNGASTRNERLKSALKANLQRRKAQARRRADGAKTQSGSEPEKQG